MKRAAILAVALMLLLPVITLSQTKKHRTTTRRPRTVASQKTSDQVNDGATHVADQIKILTRFLYLLGGVSKGIEAADAAARRKEAPPAVIQQTEKSKATVKASLQNVREGLDKLEIEFRTTPALQRYYIKLAGVASGAATAEDQAGVGQFDQAGRTLLGVVSRLTDVLLEMR